MTRARLLLVAVGLVLIVVRIILRQSNQWLIGANVASLAIALYACAFVNFPHVIARYNLLHSAEWMKGGIPFDFAYAISLGAHAIPTMDRYAAAYPTAAPMLVAARDKLAADHVEAMRDWRAVTLSGLRLQRYLDRQARAKESAAGRIRNP